MRVWARMSLALTVTVAAVAAPLASARAAVPPGEASWVSAGDSYSSGEGVAGNRGACAQSDQAYGPIAADLERQAGWDIGAEAFTACTGHLIEDLFNQRPGLSNDALWDWGLQQGAPDRVDLLTFSFGGNDIGFADLLLDCLPLPDSSTQAFTSFVTGDTLDLTGCDTPEPEVDARIDALLDPPRRSCRGGRHPDRQAGGDPYECDLLIDDRGNSDPSDDVRGSLVDFYVYVATEHLTETGHMVVVGYPNLFAPVGEWPGWVPIQCQGITRGDTERISRLSAHLEDALITAVRRANDELGRERVHYLPRSILYRDGGHELCGPGDDWLNGLSVRRGDGSVRAETSFHPNVAGHAATAQALVRLLEPVRFELPRADLTNVELPPDACSWVLQYGDIGAADPMRLVDGAVPLTSDFDAFIEIDDQTAPFFADVDGDGTEEGIVSILCNAGGSGITEEVHVYTAAGEYLDGFIVGDGVEGRPLLNSLEVGDGVITVRTFGTRPNEPLCCGSLPVTDLYRLNGGQTIELIDRQVGP